MPRTLFVVLMSAVIAFAVPAAAQDEDATKPASDEPTFNLDPSVGRDDLETAVQDQAPAYQPILPRKKLEASVTLGYWDLANTLIKMDQLIYKYTDEYTYYGDVEIQGESAFNPMIRLSYDLDTWMSVEGFFDLSVSEYFATITNPNRLSNAAEGASLQPVEELGEFDAERRSNITLGAGMNVLFYPRDYGNFGKGRFHPYVIGGASRVWMSINSDYAEDAASQWRLSGGLGFRYIADDLISVRFEMLMNHMTYQFTPRDYFSDIDDGTTLIPVYQYVDGQGAVEVESFESYTLNSMSWALGFFANF
ncbi:MAG TPA: hypothetical protein P5571_01970 [Candidatus Krumholzibacteria bacterium]|nr:hypothetical protein [Candidatus Krumholzibacteria bacterium]HRX50118.1 hypothetical protein [Candidatus Krumholzibacteria bacterium]